MDKVEISLRTLLSSKSRKQGLDILALKIMPDHVHLFVNAPPTLAPDQITEGIHVAETAAVVPSPQAHALHVDQKLLYLYCGQRFFGNYQALHCQATHEGLTASRPFIHTDESVGFLAHRL